jgi:ubiquitin C-terminal hydrolase
MEPDKDSDNLYLNFGGLNYIANSCYQDSVLFALFAIPNSTITEHILIKNVQDISDYKNKWTICGSNNEEDYSIRKNIQDEIINITNSMRKIEKTQNCSTLRYLMSFCSSQQNFHLGGQQDAGEFLTHIFRLFQIDFSISTTTTFVTNDLGDNADWIKVGCTTDNMASPIIDVSSFQIINKSKIYINEFQIQVDDDTFTEDNFFLFNDKYYKRRKCINKIFNSPYKVFRIHRVHRTEEVLRNRIKVKNVKLKTIIIPVQKINNLDLSSIVVHKGRHYTCYIKYRGIWFYYDDNPGKNSYVIIRVGNYDDMINSTPSVKTNGVLYFYT